MYQIQDEFAATSQTIRSQSASPRSKEVDDEVGDALVVSLTVALWVAISVVFHLQRGHLLLRIPLTFAFQVAIRRQPLKTLCVRHPIQLGLRIRGWTVAALLSLYPAYNVYAIVQALSPAAKIAMAIVTVAGAVPIAYAVVNFRRAMLRPLLLCLATAGGIEVLIVMLLAIHCAEHYTVLHRVQLLLTGMLCYLPICFLVEEVSFRGAFDAHVHHESESRSVWSALFISALCGVSHVPAVIAQAPVLFALPASLCCIARLACHSRFWPKSGNLLVPSSAHAIADAVRNALLCVPR